MYFPNEVQLDVLKFLPYENAKNMLMVRKYWVLPLAILIREQRIAMLSEILRLYESHRALENLRFQYMQQYLVTKNRIERAGSDFALQITVRERNVQPGQWPLENVQLLNEYMQSLQTLQPDFDAASLELLRIKMKMEALVDKRNRLNAILGRDAEKTVNDRITELEEQKNRRRERIDQLGTISLRISFISVVFYTLLMMLQVMISMDWLSDFFLPTSRVCLYYFVFYQFLKLCIDYRKYSHKCKIGLIDKEIDNINNIFAA
ncbi:hypothetical protein DdX_06754 [Ditylenchus destructor]|uniref:Uncharacterized protein n=1 Tax=Ditylenchus destructor TaxID=166010 RepID=A0AAD4N558_9BILA|nr:hypothetical protein DdX_06754 [Ditylenchus destructor]